MATLIYWYSHWLNIHNRMKMAFSHSTVCTTALKNFMVMKLPGMATNKEFLIKTFKKSKNIWNILSYSFRLWNMNLQIEQAKKWIHEYCYRLCRFQYKFDIKFLIISYKIFRFSDVLFEKFQNKCMVISYCINKVSEFYELLQKVRHGIKFAMKIQPDHNGYYLLDLGLL